MGVTIQAAPPESAAPHDRLAEQRVIGALLIDRDAIFKVADVLRPADFFVPAHERIYSSALALLERRERIDPLTIQVELARREVLDQVGGPRYLAELAEVVPTAVDVEQHARQVRDRSVMRGLLGAARAIAADAYGEPTDTALALDRAEQRIFALRDEATSAQLRHILPALLQNYEHLTERMEHPFELSGVPSGFREIDGYTEGFTPGDLIIIAARPSVGKTSLGLAIAYNAAKRGENTLLFSLEMDTKQIVARFLGLNSRNDLLALRTGLMDPEAATALMELPVLIDDTPGISIMELRTKARRATAYGRLGLIVIDYLQLVLTGEREENRVQEIATISRNLKSLARELHVPIIALAQVGRQVDLREDRRPLLSDLRESGSIEQDADYVLFTYRDEYYEQSKKPKEGTDAFAAWERRMKEIEGVAEVIVAKNRHGRTGIVTLGYRADVTQFLNEPEPREIVPEEVRQRAAKKPTFTAEGTILYGLLKSLTLTRSTVASNEQRASDHRLCKGARLIPLEVARAAFRSEILPEEEPESDVVKRRFSAAFTSIRKAGIGQYHGNADTGIHLWLPELVAEG